MNQNSPLPDPLRVDLGSRSYDIRFYKNAPDRIAADLKPFCPEKAFVVSNETIWPLHGEQLASSLKAAGIEFSVALVPDGEKYKTLDSARMLYDRLIEGGFGRRTCLVALGGGVVGDLAGLVAATFLRGVNFVQIPTTVLAMVDSSVGGKTGVDHPLGKNLIGAFYQPQLVAIDINYLSTLDKHNLQGGFGEVIKYGVIRDPVFFSYLEENISAAFQLQPAQMFHCIRTSCAVKADVVSRDEREGGLRMILNYGHTFAHAIETAGMYKERQFHGQAVAIGMHAAAQMACDLGLFSKENVQRQENLLNKAGLPVRLPPGVQPHEVANGMKTDKKVQGGKIRFVIPREIGRVEIRDDIDKTSVLKVLQGITSLI